MQLAPRTEEFLDEDRRWIGDSKKLQADRTVNVDPALFAAAFPDGLLKSGLVLARQAAGQKLWGPYGGGTNEVQTLTEGGAGLTSFTLTFAGQTTAAIDDDATAAEVQAALEALSNLAPGDVTVTGGPLGVGPMTVTFGGTLADTDVAALTSTPTGGTGTVVVATATAGNANAGSGGLETAVGFLYTTTRLRLDGGVASLPLYDNGAVKPALLPYADGPGALDAAARADLAPHIRFYD